MNASPVRLKRPVVNLILLMIAFCLAPPTGYAAAFPEPPVIRPAVRFWLSIYTRFGLTQGVVHDSRDPGIVYGVIDLEPPDAPAAHRINEHRMRRARKRYRQMIDRYCQNPGSDSQGKLGGYVVH